MKTLLYMYLSCFLILILKIEIISTSFLQNDQIAAKLPTKFNSVGHKTSINPLLSTFPMKVTRCDQIAIFPAKYIVDLNDYKHREDGWFSITAYTINLYKDKDANKLIHSVDFGNLKTKPSYLEGALGCVSVEGGSVLADITLCFDDKSRAENMLSVIETFYKCRRGDNLKPIPKKLMRELLQVCSGTGKIIRSPKRQLREFSSVRPGNKWDQDRDKYFRPGKISVPGTK